MKKMLLVLGAILLAPAAFAQGPDYSLLDDHNCPDFAKKMACIKTGWDASNPTDAQKESADQYMNEAKGVYEQHADALKESMQAMKDAWKKHPVSRDEVIASEEALREHGTPVKEAFRDAGINTLNLLSAEQRALFDSAFEACLKE